MVAAELMHVCMTMSVSEILKAGLAHSYMALRLAHIHDNRLLPQNLHNNAE
jgi:hypothetical protein